MIYKKAFWFCRKVGDWILCLLSLYAGPVYLFTVFLFHLYSCANIISKLITQAKYWQLHRINQQTENYRKQRKTKRYEKLSMELRFKPCLVQKQRDIRGLRELLLRSLQDSNNVGIDDKWKFSWPIRKTWHIRGSH